MANGEVQTNEEARVYVHDLNLFVTVQLLEDTLALSPGKLCEEHGYTCEWASGPKPHPTERWEEHFYARRTISCLLLSRDCRQAPAQARLLHRWRRIHQVRRIQQIYEVTSVRKLAQAT